MALFDLILDNKLFRCVLQRSLALRNVFSAFLHYGVLMRWMPPRLSHSYRSQIVCVFNTMSEFDESHGMSAFSWEQNALVTCDGQKVSWES